MSEKWTHDALMDDLAKCLLSKSDRMVWRDMQLGPSGSPRPDVYTINKMYCRPTPLSYECKISVADFRSDVTSGKWQSYLQFSSAVIFAVPAKLIDKKDIPAGCGLMVRSESGWRMTKGPTLNPVRMPQEVLLKLLMDGVHREGFAELKRAEFEAWRASKKVSKRFGQTVATLAKDVHGLDDKIQSAKDHAERIVERAKLEADGIIKHESQQRLNVDGERERLCKLMGLPPDADWFDILVRARSIREQIDQSSEVARLKNALKQIKRDTLRILADGEEWLSKAETKSEGVAA